VPGLNCTADLFGPQIAAFGDRFDITVVDHASDAAIADIARRLLAAAPPRFALAGLSMGGYVALEVMRQAPQRVERLALLDTRASADAPEDTEIRLAAIKFAETGRFDDIHGILWPRLVHIKRLGDADLEAVVRRMAEKTGPARFIRGRTSSRGSRRSAARRWCWWARTTPSRRASCRRTWRTPLPAHRWSWCRIAATCRRWSGPKR
jgi:pimeloyl-ACP methyl ester carboxylesterase